MDYKIIEFTETKTWVGFPIKSEFPGFTEKAQWLTDSFDQLVSMVGYYKGEYEKFYFIYHGLHAPMVCVEKSGDLQIPEQLEVITMKPQKFAIFIHRGKISEQEETFNKLCESDFHVDSEGTHFELHSLEELKRASSEHFEFPIYLPASSD